MTVTVLLFASYADALGERIDPARACRTARPSRRCFAASATMAGAARLPAEPMVAVNEEYARVRPRARRGRRGRDHSAGGGRLMRSAIVDRRRSTRRRSPPRSRTTATAPTVALSRNRPRRRTTGARVTGIEYSAYRSMAERELAAIVARGEQPISARRTSSSSIESGTLELGEVERRDRRRASASRRRVRRQPLRDRADQAPRADLEARALRRRDARVGRSRPRIARRADAAGTRLMQTPRSLRPVRAEHRVSADLGHRPVQLPLPVLHAGGGARVAAQVGHPLATRRSPTSSASSRRSGFAGFASPAASRRSGRRSTS